MALSAASLPGQVPFELLRAKRSTIHANTNFDQNLDPTEG